MKNIFIISPGRTATYAMSKAFSNVSDYTCAHESRVGFFNDQRINYPDNHIELDNRLSFYLPQLTRKYSKKNSLLVIVNRDRNSIAKSYNKRWRKINIMKAFSQGIHMNDLQSNNIDVCLAYVNYIYETIDYFKPQWDNVLEIEFSDLNFGIEQILKKINKINDLENVLEEMKNKSNLNETSLKIKLADARFNFINLIKDLFS